MVRFLVLLVTISMIGLQAACQRSNPGPSGAMLSESERVTVLAFSEAEMDRLFKEGWNKDDYAVFSEGFSEEMLTSMPPEEFEKLKMDEKKGLGRYFGREVESVVQRSDGSYTVIYYAVFERDDDVLLRARFQAEEPHLISGLWFEK